MRLAAVVLALALVAACSNSGRGAGAPASTTSSAPPTTAALVPPTVAGGIRLTDTTAPDGFDVAGARWIQIDRPDGHTQLAAIFVPDGPGPFPTVVFFHGVSGLSKLQLLWLPKLAAAGYLVLAGCYRAASTTSVNAALFLPCGGLPPNGKNDADSIGAGYRALLTTARALGAAAPGPIGAVGVSFGAGVALDAEDPNVAVIVADSGFGSDPPSGVSAPVLLLGGTADPMVAHADLVAYERALRAAGKTVESHYYDGAGHAVTQIGATSDDAIRRTISFLDRYLK